MKKVVIFDSGVGGLSIYQEIQALLPQVQFIYAFDNAAFPYGALADDVLIERTNHIITLLVERHQADLVVIACNTASTIVLPSLREKLTIPVVGVVPAIKPAAQMSKNKKIGLLATPATVNRSYTHQLVNQFAKDCEIQMIGSIRLVEMAEQKLRGESVDIAEIEQILQPWQGYVDSIVLGCTHFPLIKQEIQAAFKDEITIVDSGSAIARRVSSLLAIEPTSNELLLNTENIAYSTTTKNVAALNESLMKMQLGIIQSLNYPHF